MFTSYIHGKGVKHFNHIVDMNGLKRYEHPQKQMY